MPCEDAHTCALLCFLHLPQSNASIEASTGQQAPIETPFQRVHRAALDGESREVRTPVGIPELDGGIISTTGEHASVGSKGEALDAAAMPTHPEQGTILQVPQLDGPIPAPGGEYVSIRTEGEGLYCGGMCLPGQVQDLSSLAPHACSPPPAASSPVVPIGACGHRPGGIKGLGKDCIADYSPGQRRILHLNALQIHAAKRKIRQIKTA